MLDAATLPRLLAQLPTLAFSGTLYRAIDYEALHGFHSAAPYLPDPLYCLGASEKGARYGVVEASCKQVVTQRLKLAGMHWRQETAEAVLAVRAAQLSMGAPDLRHYGGGPN
jgi:hypothetical protein